MTTSVPSPPDRQLGRSQRGDFNAATVADAPQAPVVDYYAGAIAFLAVTMFARYAIHKTKERTPKLERRATFWHRFCVIGSAVGILASLAVLGFDETNRFGGFEIFPRYLVAAAAILAAVVLAIDISTTSTPPKGQRGPAADPALSRSQPTAACCRPAD